MEISQPAAIALAQIIPILLLASYFDRDALENVGRSNVYTRAYWVCNIALILFGEMIAVLGTIDGSMHGWRGYAVVLAVILCLANLFSIAMWRMFGLNLISGLPVDTGKKLHQIIKRKKR